MRKSGEAEKYCQRLLQAFSSDVNVLDLLYNELIDIASIKDDHESTDYWIQKSIQSKMPMPLLDDRGKIFKSDRLI